ncbi:MAG: 16S rRNA (adenine(1518)-N(6)/adenine(1519)-N(6))-dimethyltransferase RsmA [Acidimicrobiales bacterium]|nr:16S rRNA (adenine(1518)-N(6)/adenine(1519)-N(6))-dimethyltransferase RsmA [Acidimicrobiales bacterium]
MTLTRSQVRAQLASLGVSPSRALGQNFVVDPNVVRRIARLAGVGPGDHVVEIGAGLGSLTLALCETGANVLAVEVDRHLFGCLRENVEPAGASVVLADARQTDWHSLLAGAQEWTLVANLPYNIATPLVLDLLDGVPKIQRMLVMVQREAGERLVAGPGEPAYGIPSAKVAYWADGEIVGRVGPAVFHPQPKVESVLVSIKRRPRPAVSADPEIVFALVRQAFGQRRKMLRRSLANLVTAEQFAATGIDPSRRPEHLGIEEWGRLAQAVALGGTEGRG